MSALSENLDSAENLVRNSMELLHATVAHGKSNKGRKRRLSSFCFSTAEKQN